MPINLIRTYKTPMRLTIDEIISLDNIIKKFSFTVQVIEDDGETQKISIYSLFDRDKDDLFLTGVEVGKFEINKIPNWEKFPPLQKGHHSLHYSLMSRYIREAISKINKLLLFSKKL